MQRINRIVRKQFGGSTLVMRNVLLPFSSTLVQKKPALSEPKLGKSLLRKGGLSSAQTYCRGVYPVE